jgi:hypothetical protein
LFCLGEPVQETRLYVVHGWKEMIPEKMSKIDRHSREFRGEKAVMTKFRH